MTDPASATEQTEQPRAPPSGAAPESNTAFGSIFSKITLALSDEELTNPAVIKLILNLMYRAEAKRDEFERYVPLYYAADKDVAVLKAKLNTNTMVDIFYGMGMALGGAAAGFVPYFWDEQHVLPTVICASFAVILVVGAVLVRILGPHR